MIYCQNINQDSDQTTDITLVALLGAMNSWNVNVDNGLLNGVVLQIKLIG